MIRYTLINSHRGDLSITLLVFPQEVVDFLKKESVYLTHNGVILGIINKALYIDNIRGSNGSPVSIKLPLYSLLKPENRKAEPWHGYGYRSSIKFHGAYDSVLVVETLVIAIKELFEQALGSKSLIKLSAPYTLPIR